MQNECFGVIMKKNPKDLALLPLNNKQQVKLFFFKEIQPVTTWRQYQKINRT